MGRYVKLSNSVCPAPDITRCGLFVWLGLVNTMILNLPWASKGRLILEQLGTCLNFNSLEPVCHEERAILPQICHTLGYSI